MSKKEIHGILGAPVFSKDYSIYEPHGSPAYTDDVYVLSLGSTVVDESKVFFIVSYDNNDYGPQHNDMNKVVEYQIVTVSKDCPLVKGYLGAMTIY